MAESPEGLTTGTEGLSRRDLLRRGAIFGGAVAWATPLVQTLGMSPALAAATSPVPCENGFSGSAVWMPEQGWRVEGLDAVVGISGEGSSFILAEGCTITGVSAKTDDGWVSGTFSGGSGWVRIPDGNDSESPSGIYEVRVSFSCCFDGHEDTGGEVPEDRPEPTGGLFGEVPEDRPEDTGGLFGEVPEDRPEP